MTAPSPDPAARVPRPPTPLGRWQYSLKFLLIFTTGVCIWAKLATVVYPLCGGPIWFKATFIVWTGALLAQAAFHVWAWRQLKRDAGPGTEFPSGRFRVSLLWGTVPGSLWLLTGLAAFKEPAAMGSDGFMFIGITVLHVALPTALILIASTLRGNDVYPLRVVRWSIAVSCLVPMAGAVLACVQAV